MASLHTPLDEARHRLNHASRAMDGFMSLLSNCGTEQRLDAEQMRFLLMPIQEEMHSALDELSVAEAGHGQAAPGS